MAFLKERKTTVGASFVHPATASANLVWPQAQESRLAQLEEKMDLILEVPIYVHTFFCFSLFPLVSLDMLAVQKIWSRKRSRDAKILYWREFKSLRH